jgi:hypothetical protein
MPILPAVSSSAMHGAVVPIASATVTGSTTANISFTGIPQNYQDLYCVCYSAATTTGVYLNLIYNNDASAIYSRTYLYGNGSSAYSTRTTSETAAYWTTGALPNTTNLFQSSIFNVLNYASTNTFKTLIGREANDANGSGITSLIGSLYRSTSAITSLTINTTSAYFAAGTTIRLYGIRTVGQ